MAGTSDWQESGRIAGEKQDRDQELLARLRDQDSRLVDRRAEIQRLTENYHPESGISEMVRNFARDRVLPSSEQAHMPMPEIGSTQIIRPHVLEDKKSGATVVEGLHTLPYLKKETAQQVVDELGVDITLPDDWDHKAIVKKDDWLNEHKIYAVQQLGEPREELMLPEIKGGSGVFDYENVLEEEIIVREPNFATGRMEKIKKTVPVTLRTAIARLTEILEKKGTLGLSSEDLTEINENYDKLTNYFRENFLSRATAIAERRIQDYTFLNDMVKTIHESTRRYGGSSFFNEIISKEDLAKLENGRNSLDKDYRDKYKQNPNKYEELFHRLEEDAAQVIQIQKYGLYGKGNQQREEFDDTLEAEIAAAASSEDKDMLRWRGTVLKEGFDLNYNEIRIKQPTADWRDSEKNLDLILRYLERTEFTDQQLSAALQAAAQIVNDIPVNSPSMSKEEKEEAEKLQNELTYKLQAILAVDSFYTVMEHADMNPEKVLGAFSSFKDDTLEIFFKRFEHDSKGGQFKDKDGNAIFMKGKDGNVLKDDHHKDRNINLLNIGMGVYMKRLNTERRIMNYIEKWTRNIDIAPGRAEQGIEEECNAALKKIKEEMGMVDDKGNEVAGVFNDKGKMGEAVSKWYRENTILGAHDEHTKEERKEEMVGDLKALDELTDDEKKKRDAKNHERLWKKGLVEVLRDDYKLGEPQLKEMIDSGMIEQVMNNAHRLSWMMAWSDYDGIRIWDPREENPANPGTGRVVKFLYNQSTHMFHGRMIDHTMDFYVDENRGRVNKSNMIFQDELLGDHGNLFPQNRTMVRFTKDLLGDQAKAYYESKKGNFKNMNKLDLSNFEENMWAESAVFAEGLDNGDISYENADFAGLFKTRGSWKYRMIDLYADRKAMMDYVSPNLLQGYLLTPNTEKFFQVNSYENFYSKREVRLHPWMKIAIGAHNRIGDHWKEWWGMDDRMTHAEKEAVIEVSAVSNRLDAKYKHPMKHDLLGWGGVPGYMPVRNFRQFSEAVDIYSREAAKGTPKAVPTMVGAWGRTFVSQGFKYITS